MKIFKLPFAAALLACAFAAPSFEAQAAGKGLQRGAASWYGPGFHGRPTASGETFNTHAMTAAHRSLPFGTKVRVVNERNGRSVVVRINCPSSDNLRQVAGFRSGGSGSSGFEVRRPSRGAASGDWRSSVV